MIKDTILTAIKKQLIHILPELREEDIHEDSKMAKLGANSVDRADIIVAVMEEFHIKMPLLSLSKAQNIGELAELFAAEVTRHGN